MKCKITHTDYAGNGISLFVIPETQNEREVLEALWKHGRLNTCNGVADYSPQGFRIVCNLVEVKP